MSTSDQGVTEHLLEAAAPVVEQEQVGGREAMGGVRGEEEFIDVVAEELAHGDLPRVRRCGAAGDHDATGHGQPRQRGQPSGAVADLEEFPLGPRLRVSQFLVARVLQPGADQGLVEQLIVAPTDQEAQPMMVEPGQHRGRPVQAV